MTKFEVFPQPDEPVGKPDQPGSLGSVSQNNSLGTLLCLCRFSLIQSQNCTPFVFFGYLTL